MTIPQAAVSYEAMEHYIEDQHSTSPSEPLVPIVRVREYTHARTHKSFLFAYTHACMSNHAYVPAIHAPVRAHMGGASGCASALLHMHASTDECRMK